MQAAFLISARGYSEKQVGLLFLVFGLSQFMCMAPAGYFLDYSNRKIIIVIWSSIITSLLTVISVISAHENGQNMTWLVICHALQGGMTAFLPPGFNGITLGIVGASGFTYQVSRNRMMNHVGTALNVAIGSLTAYSLYPKIGALFAVSPLAALGVWYYLNQIIPTHIHKDAARALILESPTLTEYELYDEVASYKQQAAEALSWNPSQWCVVVPNHINAALQNDCNVNNNTAVMNNNQTNANTFSGSLDSGDYSGLPPRSCQTTSSFSWSADPQPPPSKVAAPRLHRLDAPFPTPSVPVYNHHSYFQQQQQQSLTYQPPGPLSDASSDACDPSFSSSPPTSPTNVGQSNFGHLPTLWSEESYNSDGRHPVTPALSHFTSGQETQSSIPSFRMGWSSWTCNSSIGTSTIPSVPDNDHRIPPDQQQQTPQDATIPPGHVSKDVDDQSSCAPPRKAQSPLSVLSDVNLILFVTIVFLFHLANSSVLPLVMQSLSLKDVQAGILLSGLCIVIMRRLQRHVGTQGSHVGWIGESAIEMFSADILAMEDRPTNRHGE
jgi:Major Facilitator Superfamily